VIPIISREDYESLDLDQHNVDVLVYRDYDNLFEIIKELEGTSHKKSLKNREFALRYLGERLAVAAKGAIVAAAGS